MLSDLKLRSLKATGKPYKVSDGGGLHVLVTAQGSRLWRLSYRLGGKQKGLALGRYPEIGLAEARNARQAAKAALASGRDPALVRAAEKLAANALPTDTFRSVAEEWFERQRTRWVDSYASRVRSRLEEDIFSQIGDRPIAEIQPLEILASVRRLERRGSREMARRMLQFCSSIFRYAIATGRRNDNPAINLRDALTPASTGKHRAMIDASELPEMLSRIESYEGDARTTIALRLIMLTAVRTQELRFARWQEVDFDDALWRVPAERMKMRKPHIVPLARQTLALLHDLRRLSQGELWFAAATRSGVISENTLIYALYRMGYHSRATTHGFRALFSTVLNESGQFESDWIEAQLAHSKERVRGAYNHAKYIDPRRRMMQWWADWLDEKRAASLRPEV